MGRYRSSDEASEKGEEVERVAIESAEGYAIEGVASDAAEDDEAEEEAVVNRAGEEEGRGEVDDW